MLCRFIFGLAFAAAMLLGTPGARAEFPPATGQDRALVFVVPGTIAGDPYWDNVRPDQATFASEILRALGAGSSVEPFVWSGQNTHAAIEAAAGDLASAIDRRAMDFDRVCLVGHGQGGNVSLRAAGICHSKLDTVVCLATPHAYWAMPDRGGKGILLPVFCTWEARQNIATIVSLGPNTAPVLANVLGPLVAEMPDVDSARDLRNSWAGHAEKGSPALEADAASVGAGKGKDLVVSDELNVADANITYHTYVNAQVEPGPRQYVAAHSRRMGYVIGQLLNDGPTPVRLNYLRTILQPSESDTGEPIASADQEAWLAEHDADFKWMGWWLKNVTVHVTPEAKDVTRNIDPSPIVKIYAHARDGGKLLYDVGHAKNTYDASWPTWYVLWKHQTVELTVTSENAMSPIKLGTRAIWEDHLMRDFEVDTFRGIYWSGELNWVAVHL